jgi:Transglutaminase-like superfamily
VAASAARPRPGRAVPRPGVAAVAVAAPVLARLDLPRLYRWLEPSPRSSRPAPADPGRVIAIFGRRVDRAIRWGKPLVRAGCLTRGITGYYILRRAGLDVALCFGVGPERDPGVLGHCWLVFGGEPVLEASDPRAAYTELVRMSSRGLTTASPAP